MKTVKDGELRRLVLDALTGTLGDVPFLKVAKPQSMRLTKGCHPPIVLAVRTEGRGRRTLMLEVRSSGQPRLVREGINQLARYREADPGAYGIVAAPYLSPASAKLCTEDGVGYLDLAGNCRIVFDTVYVVREGNENTFSVKRDLRSLYSPRATRVLRVLLTAPARFWKTSPLSREANVSFGQVSNVKKLLNLREWIDQTGDGFRLSKPDQALAEWAANYTFRKNEVRDFYSTRSLPEVEATIAAVCSNRGIRYALTGFSGAARRAPGIRYQKVTAYVEQLDERICGEAGLKEVPSGANVTVLQPYDSGVFYGMSEHEGLEVVSGVQLYLDLKNSMGRGEEAAQTVYEKVVRPSW